MNRQTPGRLVAVIAVAISLSACIGGGPRDADDWGMAMPAAMVPAQASNGTIYQAHSSVALFSDVKARRVGDILTIRLQEKTNASKSSSTSTDKSTGIDIGTPTVFGRPVTADGIGVLSGNAQASQSFSGEGDSSQSNSLQGSVTVTIEQVLANGNLFVRGQKLVTLNQGREYIRVSGIVRPVDIGTDNSLMSEKLANAKISYSGKGALADANRMSWLGRFFHSPLMPF